MKLSKAGRANLKNKFGGCCDPRDKRIAELEVREAMLVGALSGIIDALSDEGIKCGEKLRNAVLVGMGLTF